jgi:outer membrane receptor for ferrienterochelin and colicins
MSTNGTRAMHSRLAALLALLYAGLAAADETASAAFPDLDALSMEELMDLRVDRVYSASRFEQKVTRAPASVTILTAADIRTYGYRTLADILRSVRGVYVTYDRNYSYVGVRGFARPGDYNTRVLLLVDGQRMNDSIYSQAMVGSEETLDVDLIERVEVIRGPSSSIYGNSAFFGVINIVTRTGSEIHGMEAAVQAGSFDTGKARLTFGKQFSSERGFVFSASAMNSDGRGKLYYPEFAAAETNNGFAIDSDGDSSRSAFASLNLGELTFSAAYSSRTKDIPTASFETVFNDRSESSTDEREYFDVKYVHTFGSTHFSGSLRYDRYVYLGNYPYDWAEPGDPQSIVLNHDDARTSGVVANFQATRAFLDRHTVVVGGEYSADLDTYQSNFEADGTSNFVFHDEGRSAGLYVQAELALATQLLLNAGVRYDYHERFGSTINPRVGLIYNPWQSGTFKVLYGDAYRAPNAYERLDAPGYQKSSPDLEPETITTYEGVYEQYVGHRFRFSVSGYRYEVSDLISEQLDPVDGLRQFLNVDSVLAHGLEVEVERKQEGGLSLRASYARQRAEDRITGEELTNSPRHMAKVNVSAPLFRETLNGAIEIQYLGGMRTLAGETTGGFVLGNATLSARLVEKLNLSLSVYNLLDRDYSYPGTAGHLQDSIEQDGRTFSAKATWQF